MPNLTKEQRANKNRRRWQWFHDIKNVGLVRADGANGARVRRRQRPTTKPFWCMHEGKWRAVPRGGYASR